MLSKISLALVFYFLLFSSGFAEEMSIYETKASFPELVAGLITNKFDAKATLIEKIQQTKHPQARALLSNLLEGKVYYRKDDKSVVIVDITGKNAEMINPESGESVGKIAKNKLKKVGINNKLRRVLNSSIAQLSLADKDPEVRKSAAIEMFKSMDEHMSTTLKERLAVERDKDVLDALQTAISIHQLNSPFFEQKLNAIESLSSSLYPDVRVALKDLERDLSSKPVNQSSEALQQAVQKSLNTIESRVSLYKQVENVFFGISLGSVLLLIAVGLAITFGVMGVINMAHGEMLMLGAYTTYIIQQLLPDYIEYSILISIPTAFVFTALVGIGIERGVIRFLYGRPLETLLATFGISLILQQAVRTIISPQNRAVSTPDWMSGSFEINPALSLTYNRFYIIIFALLVLAGLMLLLNKSKFGLQVRAVTQNRSMAKAMGIRTDWVDAFTFGLGSGIAGIAGVALSQLTNVGPNLGQAYIIDSFMVVVFGGVGNLWGTLFGAMTLGIANKYLEPFTGAVLAKILILIFIILFIQKRPRGMFALKGRSVDS